MTEESIAVVEKVSPIDTTKKQQIPLTSEQLQAIWQQDEYWGQGGSYDCDPFTGKRTPKKD